MRYFHVTLHVNRDNFLYMKELIYARLYLPAIQKYGENTGIVDGLSLIHI